MRRAAHQQAFLAIISAFLICQADALGADVKLTYDGPGILGSMVTFRADLIDSDGKTPSGKFNYSWKDDALQQHTYSTGLTRNTTTYYSVSYPVSNYYVGVYRMEVLVCKAGWFHYCSQYTSRRINFRLTRLLNGNLIIKQSNKTIKNNFVSNAEVSKLSVDLRKSDLDCIRTTASSIIVYWFIDCQFYNQTNDFTLDYNFTDSNSFHTIEVLVVASSDSQSTTTESTTTTSMTHSVPVNGTTSVLTSNVIASTTASIISSTTTQTHMLTPSNKTVPILANQTFPYLCKSTIEPEPNKTYGYFQREVNSRAPISKLNIEGSTWIQPWNSLSLTISCNGTGPFHKCIQIHEGKYNATGNETCSQDTETLDICKFSFNYYFLDALEYTLLIILSNDISTEIHPVAVNIYKLTPKPQLSVIVVPVSCSLIAVVVIVFGIAYYVQNKARFTVEVADFDFGQSNPDMEYKTFTERLRDSFNNAVRPRDERLLGANTPYYGSIENGYKRLDEVKESQQEHPQNTVEK